MEFDVSGGTATGDGIDYTLAAGTLTFSPGETSRSIPITIIDDGLDEDDETILVTLSDPTNANLGGLVTHTYAIRDDDGAPTVAFALVSSENPESVTSASLEFSVPTASRSQPFLKKFRWRLSIQMPNSSTAFEMILNCFASYLLEDSKRSSPNSCPGKDTLWN